MLLTVRSVLEAASDSTSWLPAFAGAVARRDLATTHFQTRSEYRASRFSKTRASVAIRPLRRCYRSHAWSPRAVRARLRD